MICPQLYHQQETNTNFLSFTYRHELKQASSYNFFIFLMQIIRFPYIHTFNDLLSNTYKPCKVIRTTEISLTFMYTNVLHMLVQLRVTGIYVFLYSLKDVNVSEAGCLSFRECFWKKYKKSYTYANVFIVVC
jgi:hypothetical protein